MAAVDLVFVHCTMDITPRCRFMTLRDELAALSEVDFSQRHVTSLSIGIDGIKVTMLPEVHEGTKILLGYAQEIQEELERKSLLSNGFPEQVDEQVVRELVKETCSEKDWRLYSRKHPLSLLHLITPEDYAAAVAA
jgi:hypothetical protein